MQFPLRSRGLAIVVALLIICVSITPLKAQQADSREIQRYGNGSVNAIAWSPDGNTIVIGGGLGLWLYTTDFRNIAHFSTDERGIVDVAWSPDSHYVASVSKRGAVQIWDISSGQATDLLKAGTQELKDLWKGYNLLSWSPDGSKLAVTLAKSSVAIWDTKTAKQLKSLTFNGHINAIDWSEDGKTLAVGGSAPKVGEQVSGIAQIWDSSTGKVLKSKTFDPIEGDDTTDASVRRVQWRHGTDVLEIMYGWGQATQIKIWDSGTDKLDLADAGLAGAEYIDDFSWSRNGKFIGIIVHEVQASIDSNYPGEIVISRTYVSEGTVYPTEGDAAQRIAWSPDGERMVVVEEHGTLSMVDNRPPKADLAPFIGRRLTACDYEDRSYGDFLKDGSVSVGKVCTAATTADTPDFSMVEPKVHPNIAVAPGVEIGPYDRKSAESTQHLLIQDPTGGNPILINKKTGIVIGLGLCTGLDVSICNTHYIGIAGAAFSPDEKLLTAVTDDGIAFWDSETGVLLTLIKLKQPIGNQVQWNRSGTHLINDDIQFSYEQRKPITTLLVIDAQGNVTQKLHDSVGGLRAVVWAPDDTRILVLGAEGAEVWNADTGKLLTTIHALPIGTPKRDDFVWYFQQPDHSVQIWDMDAYKQIASLTGITGPITVANAAPDGSRFATGGDDGSIRLWSRTGSPLFTLTGHHGAIIDLTWSPNGQQILSKGEDKTYRLWDVK